MRLRRTLAEMGIETDPFVPREIALPVSRRRFGATNAWFAVLGGAGVVAAIHAPGPVAFLGGVIAVACVIDRIHFVRFMKAGPVLWLTPGELVFRRPWGGGVGRFRWEECGTFGPRLIGKRGRQFISWKIPRGGGRWDYSTTARFENETDLSDEDLVRLLNLYRERSLAPGTR